MPRSSTPRAAPQTNPKPRDAATLILLRDLHAGSTGNANLLSRVRVLMGQRTTRDAWSKLYVFPGGTVDAGDHRIPVASALKPRVANKLTRCCSGARAQAIAIAAVRETFEETGLMLGAPLTDTAFPPSADSSWSAFQQRNMAPDLGDLDFLCRAITPPYRPKRFNARFFITTADHVDDDLEGSGELNDLRWFTLEEARKLPLPLITQAVFHVLEERLRSGSIATPRRTPLFRTIRDSHLRLEE